MFFLLEKSTIENLPENVRVAMEEVEPALKLGVPVEYKDDSGTVWYVYKDERWTQDQIAILASFAVNKDTMVGYDSPHVSENPAKVTDPPAWKEEAMEVLQDTAQVDHPMTPPEDVSSATDGPPSMEEIRKAQEPTDGALDGVLRIERDLSGYTRVDPEVAG